MCDWVQIETEYVTGNDSYETLGKKHGVSRKTVGQYGGKGGWVQKRKDYQENLQAKRIQKTAEKISEDQSELAASLNRSALQFAQRVHDRLIDSGEIKPMDLLRLAQVWQILHDSITKDKDVDEDQVGGIVMMVDRTEEDENDHERG